MSTSIKTNKVYTQAKADAYLADDIMSKINTMLPCKVVAFYSDTQRVDVQPTITIKYKDESSQNFVMSRLGEYVPVSELEYPVIMNIPICHQRAGNFMLNLPIAVGDTGMIVVAQRDLDNWKANGGIQPTKTLRQFNFNDGIYLPFVPNNTNKVTNYNATMLEVRAGSEYIQMDGLGNVNVYATNVKLGKAAFEYIVKATKLKTWITNQINSVFNGHTHPAPSVVAVANSINALAPVGSVPAPNQNMSSPSESNLASISHQVGD